MLEASHPSLFCDYWRLPYRIAPAGHDNGAAAAGSGGWPECRWLRREQSGADGFPRRLYWPGLQTDSPVLGLPAPTAFRLRGVPGYGRLIPDRGAAEWLPGAGQGWRPAERVQDQGGRPVASVWRDREGSIFLPFDPDEVIMSYWSELYRVAGEAPVIAYLKRRAVQGYYRIRPVLPRSVQIALRRRLARVQTRRTFPKWPVESGLHDLYAVLFGAIAEVAEAPVPHIAPWPDGRLWTLVLTHDVETRTGYEQIPRLRGVEVELGYRSSWNFVPKRYEVHADLVDELTGSGFEVGVHGLCHDGRDLESLETLRRRLPAIREHAHRWRAVGFRSPATQRNWEWMPLLGFDYDSSYPDTDPFEPQSGGCCSWLPFFNGDLVELPITLPQDHTLFVILGHPDERMWLEKTERIRASGGMALVITHPDYTAGTPLVGAYRAFLETFRNDPSCWPALPRDVAAWWRRRAASRLVPGVAGWQVIGPAAGRAVVSYAAPEPVPLRSGDQG